MKRSLDGKTDDDAKSAWDAEIARRLRQIQEGCVVPALLTEIRRRLIGR